MTTQWGFNNASAALKLLSSCMTTRKHQAIFVHIYIFSRDDWCYRNIMIMRQCSLEPCFSSSYVFSLRPSCFNPEAWAELWSVLAAFQSMVLRLEGAQTLISCSSGWGVKNVIKNVKDWTVIEELIRPKKVSPPLPPCPSRAVLCNQ